MEELKNPVIKGFRYRITEDLTSEPAMILELARANAFIVEGKKIRCTNVF